MILNDLESRKLICPPSWLVANTQYLAITGSESYGMQTDGSDLDLVGWSIPPKEILFPHLAGHIQSFLDAPKFELYQQHHVKDPDALGGKGREVDVSVYNVARYFKLLLSNNPNAIDSIFVPQNCIIHCTLIGNMVRERRKDFLHRGIWTSLKGYSYSQLHQMTSKNPKPGSKRFENRQEMGYDTKFASHTVRLLLEGEQLLLEGDLDLQRNKEMLKSIRRGEWTQEKVFEWAGMKERQLEGALDKSPLPIKPQTEKVKQLLWDVLEHHYGNMEQVTKVLRPVELVGMVEEIEQACQKLKAAIQV